MKTKSISQTNIEEKWYVIDATGQRIGRIATISAELLMGKADPKVREYLDPKSHVVIVNASKIDFTPKRGFTKTYKSYSGYPGGLKFTTLEEVFAKNKKLPIEEAVSGMLPKTKQGRLFMSRLKIYEDSNNPHEAQKPTLIDIKKFKI